MDGLNSLWANSGDLVVGNAGSGTVNINGGTVTVAHALTIGSQGRVNLAGGRLSIDSAAFSNAGEFNWTTGVLNLTDADGVTLGSNRFAPTVTQLSNGRTLDVSQTLTVNTGNLILLDGGQVGAGRLALNGGVIAGSALNAEGIGLLSGYGTVATAITGGTAANTIQASNGNLDLGNSNSTTGFDFGGNLIVGSHQVNLLDQDQANLGASTTLGSGGRLNAANGAALGSGETLDYTGNASIFGNFNNNGAVTGSGGSLTFLNDVSGAGSFAGDIVFHAAYNPGNSPAAVDFNGGNVTYDATSVLTMEILGTTLGSEYDQLLNIEHLAFDGILNLVFGPAFSPDTEQSLVLFQFNSFSGSLAADRITVSGIDRNRLDLGSLVSNGRLQIAAVPLPAGVWLFGSGLALMGLVRRKQQGFPC